MSNTIRRAGGSKHSRFLMLASSIMLLSMVGCGSSGTDSNAGISSPVTVSPAQKVEPEKVQKIDMPLTSSAVKGSSRSGLVISATYICKHGGFPPLRWRNVPRGARELDIFALQLEGTVGSTYYAGAIAGIDPKERRLRPGKLPSGAIYGRTQDGGEGFSLCPESRDEQFVIAILAPQRRLNPAAGFDPERLREEALASSRHEGILLFKLPGER